jgi:hypothetical protein
MSTVSGNVGEREARSNGNGGGIEEAPGTRQSGQTGELLGLRCQMPIDDPYDHAIAHGRHVLARREHLPDKEEGTLRRAKDEPVSDGAQLATQSLAPGRST